MSNPSTPNDQSSLSDIPLEDIDRLLESEDPEFAKSLEEVRAVTPDQDVSIEASTTDESEAIESDEKLAEKPESRISRLKSRIRMRWMSFRNRMRERASQFGRDAIVFLKTRPKEFLLFSIVTIKALAKQSKVPFVAFKNATKAQRIGVLVLVALMAGASWVLIHNLKGVWVPSINEPILHSFESNSSEVFEFDPKEPGESFYSAFPQEQHEFLFGKMKLNLKQSPEHPLPMGAFEIIVGLDSADTSIEVRDREVELSDLIQRVFEEETFGDLSTEFGKTRLKSRIKRELNEKLTQGWVKEVHFQTFILKP